MSDKLVLKALQKGVIAAIVASDNPDLPVKMIGRTFEIPNDQKYLEFVHIPNDPNDRFWGDEKLYQGIVRLILHWPNDDKGAYDPIDVVTSVGSYFTKTRKLIQETITLNIYQQPKFTGALEGGKDTLYPLSMAYRSFDP